MKKTLKPLISAGITNRYGEPERGSIARFPSSHWKGLSIDDRSPLGRAVTAAREFLLAEQLPDGYWWAELESNATITAEYLYLLHFLGIRDERRQKKIVTYLLSSQNPNGSWSIYRGDDGDLSTTIEAYFALKMEGFPPDDPPMQTARQFILSRGGIPRARVFTKIFLALFGEYPWFGIPSMPIELMNLPDRFPVNVYSFSSWSRATIIPLSVVMAFRPVKKLPPGVTVQELYPRPPRATDYTFTRDKGVFSLKNIFIGIDHLLKLYERSPIRPGMRRGIARAEKWILEHQEGAGDWGGIQPATLNSILALHCLGYSNDHPAIVNGLAGLEIFSIETDETFVLQSCISPVWDTALALNALKASGLPPDHPSLRRGAEWLLDREVTRPGDWSITNPGLKQGGWAFEFRNDWYPDVDDSAFVMLAIRDIETGDEERKRQAIQRGLGWCLGMQSTNGGWGAFDRDNTKDFLNKIPFADLEALIDPPTADLTGRLLELLGTFGWTSKDKAIQRALTFLRENQEPEGPWWGRWGVNYIYGTWSVLCGLSAIGEDMGQPWIRRAVDWIVSVQNEDGGWGESCRSYEDRSLMGKGTSTPSQTGWALLALMAANEVDSEPVRRGIDYLITTQLPDGSWAEEEYTGTGFPKHFMIRYHIYRIVFPLTALGTYRRLKNGGDRR
ncbi:MAG: squalene--hopene cyclase [Desulfuromonadia bacterium]